MANIYLNEFDRFMSHQLKPLAYMRYGDDWLCFDSQNRLGHIRQAALIFLRQELSLTLNPGVDRCQPVHRGISYLGVDIWPTGKRLQPGVRRQVNQRLNRRNFASYKALIKAHEKSVKLNELDWRLLQKNEG